MIIRNSYVIIIAFTLTGCLRMDTKCCDFVNSYSVSDGLYIEKYRTYCAGVFGELVDCYLTDSTSFRQLIGTYDEHEHFRIKVDKENLITYNLESGLISDTVERKTVSKGELLLYNHNDTNLLSTKPLFGINTIRCDNDFYPASSYRTEDGYYLSEVQYKCGSEYSNAVFYTDSLKFSVFIGVYCPGDFINNYSVKANNDNAFEFFNVQYLRKVDTVYSKTYNLKDLKKGGFATVCKKN